MTHARINTLTVEIIEGLPKGFSVSVSRHSGLGTTMYDIVSLHPKSDPLNYGIFPRSIAIHELKLLGLTPRRAVELVRRLDLGEDNLN